MKYIWTEICFRSLVFALSSSIQLRHRLLQAASISWVMPASSNSPRSEFVHVLEGEKARVLWKCSVPAIFREIWFERNIRFFEDSEENIFLWERVRLLAFLWVSVTEEFQDPSFFFIHLNWEGVLA